MTFGAGNVNRLIFRMAKYALVTGSAIVAHVNARTKDILETSANTKRLIAQNLTVGRLITTLNNIERGYLNAIPINFRQSL